MTTMRPSIVAVATEDETVAPTNLSVADTTIFENLASAATPCQQQPFVGLQLHGLSCGPSQSQ